MFWLLLSAAELASPASFTPAVALNQREWLSDEDYPTRAAGLRRGGATRADIFVDASGKPRACYVIQSSGSKDLDGRSCAAAIHRGRFTPARDDAGQAMNGVYRFVTYWRVEDGIDNMLTSTPGWRRAPATPPADVTLTVGRLPTGRTSATVALRYVVDATGRIVRCATEQGSGYPALDRAACAAMPNRFRFAPARDKAGKAWPVIRTQLVAFEADPAGGRTETAQ